MPMEDGKGREEILVARDGGRGAPADREPGHQDVGAVDTSVRERKHLAYASHDVALIFGSSMGIRLDQEELTAPANR